jgi:serine/threonine protein kinase
MVDTRIQGQHNAVSADVVKKFGSLGANDARRLVRELRHELQIGKHSGILKLKHTTDASRNMVFERSGAWYSRSERMDRSFQAFRELLKAAGMPEKDLQDFDATQGAQSAQSNSRKLDVQVALRFLEKVEVASADSLDGALKKIGVSAPDKGVSILGKGSFGEVGLYKREGSDVVLKTLQRSVPIRWDLDALRSLGVAKIRRGDEFTQTYVRADYKLRNVIAPRYFIVKESGREAFHAVSAGRMFKNWAFEKLASRTKLEIVGTVMDKADGVPLVPDNAARMVMKSSDAAKKTDLLEIHLQKLKNDLGKLQESYKKQIADLDGTEPKTEALVKLESEIAQKRNNIARIEQALEEIQLHKDPEIVTHFQPLSKKRQAQIVKGALDMLTGMASHGFVHGDIKPANMLLDKKRENLQLIDLGGLKKISKHNESPILSLPYTRSYSNPLSFKLRSEKQGSAVVEFLSARAGHEQDMFGMGISMLEFHYRTSGRHDLVRPIWQDVANCHLSKADFSGKTMDEKVSLLQQKIQERSMEVSQGPLLAFAMNCIRLSLSVSEPEVRRYDPANTNSDHLLNQLRAAQAQ